MVWGWCGVILPWITFLDTPGKPNSTKSIIFPPSLHVSLHLKQILFADSSFSERYWLVGRRCIFNDVLSSVYTKEFHEEWFEIDVKYVFIGSMQMSILSSASWKSHDHLRYRSSNHLEDDKVYPRLIKVRRHLRTHRLILPRRSFFTQWWTRLLQRSSMRNHQDSNRFDDHKGSRII